MRIKIHRLAYTFLLFTLGFTHFSLADDNSCSIPLQEELSPPAIDLVNENGPIDPDSVIDLIKEGFDTATLEPQKSDLYVGRALPLNDASTAFPSAENGAAPQLNYQSDLAGTSGLVRARVTSQQNSNLAYQLQFSLDTHATLARNALLRRLGYAVPTPRYYRQVSVTFKSLEERDAFLDHLADDTLTSRGRWVVGGIDEVKKNQTTLIFQDVVLESAIITIPAFHWGILSSEAIQARRSIRALIVPLTLLDVPESVNMYSYDAAKIFNHEVVFSRPNADQFKNAVSIGDVRWIANKISMFTRDDWVSIIHAGYYPPDIEALVVEKTIGRMNQLMKLLRVDHFKTLNYTPLITNGKVVNGRATQENYPGYASRFAFGNPENPLSASAILRFFGIETVSSGMGGLLGQITKYLSGRSPESYVKLHQADLLQQITDFAKNNPGQSYVQPIETWGGPTFGPSINAGRSLVTGPYYGSDSQVQLVDTISAGIHAGGFVATSGLNWAGPSASAQVQYIRSYVHVRPVTDIKSSWKFNWNNVIVPRFMSKLGRVLAETDDHSAAQAMQEFLDDLKPGEMFIISDAVTASANANFTIPIGALMGGVGALVNINERLGAAGRYAVTGRTTIYRDQDGLHVYLARMKTGQFEFNLDTNFFIKLISLGRLKYDGTAHTQAFVLPDKYDNVADQRSFLNAMRALVRKTNADILREEFNPYTLDHKSFGHRNKGTFGPYMWERQENFHRMQIRPPDDPSGRYNPDDLVRTVIEGQTYKRTGRDLYSFFGSLIHNVLPFISFGEPRGGDPSANIFGKSNTLTIASQLEITEGRSNKMYVTLNRDLRGVSMKKAKLMKVIAELQTQLGRYANGGTLVNPDEFSQTEKIKAYSLLWNLVIYEDGLNKLIDKLDLKTVGTKDIQNYMVNVMGFDEYKSWCESHDLTPAFLVGPLAMEAGRERGRAIESVNGQTTVVGCATPWMQEVYRYRSYFQNHPLIFAKNIHNQDDAVEKIRLTNHFLYNLTSDEMDLEVLLRWVGEDQAFFQAKVSGFRTKDEMGDTEYFSNSIGRIDPGVLSGPINEIRDSTKIITNELEARYLTGGFFY